MSKYNYETATTQYEYLLGKEVEKLKSQVEDVKKLYKHTIEIENTVSVAGNNESSVFGIISGYSYSSEPSTTLEELYSNTAIKNSMYMNVNFNGNTYSAVYPLNLAIGYGAYGKQFEVRCLSEEGDIQGFLIYPEYSDPDTLTTVILSIEDEVEEL